MGQYYNCLIKRGNTFTNYNIQVKGKEYNGVKLCEHSWWENDFMNAMTTELYKNKARVAWVGDYAGDFHWRYDEGKPYPAALCWLAWGGTKDTQVIQEEPANEGNITLKDKVLVNHTRGIYFDCNKYYDESKVKDTNGYWCLHPLSLLTVCGNGLGGGDYDGINMEDVGDWCFDEISVEDANTIKELYPDYAEEEHYRFIENYMLENK